MPKGHALQPLLAPDRVGKPILGVFFVQRTAMVSQLRDRDACTPGPSGMVTLVGAHLDRDPLGFERQKRAAHLLPG